jgi:hypothetical protein
MLRGSSKATINDGRYTPDSGHLVAAQYRSLRAMSRLMHCNMTGEPLTLSLRTSLDIRAQIERPPLAAVSPKSAQV